MADDRDLVPEGSYFKLERDADGAYQANFYGGNGELVWWTESYADRRDAVHAIVLLERDAATAPTIAGEGVAGDEPLVDGLGASIRQPR